MRKYIDKYFNWLGIKNEGVRRIILIIHPIAMIPMFFILEQEIHEDEAFIYSLLFTPILTTAIIKALDWIKQGFAKGYDV